MIGKINSYDPRQQPLARYFPEITSAAKTINAKWWVLDGELALPIGSSFSFDHLLQRIHPAASRVAKLAQETPAIYIAFDLLMTEKKESLLSPPPRQCRYSQLPKPTSALFKLLEKRD